jgi:hypothetical protein
MYIGFPVIGFALVFVVLYFVVKSRRDTSPTRRYRGISLSSKAALAPTRGIDPDLVAELVAVLRGPGVDLEPTALELAEHGDRAGGILDRAQAGLVVRLHKRSDDFAATSALQAVNSASARLASHTHPSEQARLLDAGLSGVDRMRIWLRTRIRRQHQPADSAIPATPRPDTPSSPARETTRHTNPASAPGHSRLEPRDRNGQTSPHRERIRPAAGHARTLVEPRP